MSVPMAVIGNPVAPVIGDRISGRVIKSVQELVAETVVVQ
jgi:hypothetical protein